MTQHHPKPKYIVILSELDKLEARLEQFKARYNVMEDLTRFSTAYQQKSAKSSLLRVIREYEYKIAELKRK